MLIQITAVLLILSVAIPVVLYMRGENKKKSGKIALCTNLVMFFGMMAVTTVICFMGGASAAGEAAAVADAAGNGMAYLAAGIATGLATVGAGIAVSAAASSALGAISENEKVFGKALIFVALAEGVALYGLIISFIILGKV